MEGVAQYEAASAPMPNDGRIFRALAVATGDSPRRGRMADASRILYRTVRIARPRGQTTLWGVRVPSHGGKNADEKNI